MSKDCHDRCGEIASERLRYFTGRHMTARDFRDEQAYHRSHRYLHNRMLHGWGIVCGLHVRPHSNHDCATDHVRVECGFALDCCGRELPLEVAQVPPPVPWADRPAQPTGGPPESRYYPLLCLEYSESEIERVPVLYSEQSCDPQRQEFSRYREYIQFSWHWVRQSDLPQFYWKTVAGGCPERKKPEEQNPPAGQNPTGGRNPAGQQPPDLHKEVEGPEPLEMQHTPTATKPLHPCPDDDCDDSGSGPARCCLEPQCPPHHCVPLAIIRSEPGSRIEAKNIVMTGRPTLEPPKHALTHICHINWPHGGVIPRSHLDENLKELRIRFDRRLQNPNGQPGICGAHGVNPCTFVVQFGGDYEDLDFVTYTKPPQLEHDCVAVFTIDPRNNRREHPYAYLENQTVYITLKCDFLLDCHGIAVDGNHLGGMLPSGDGVPGGTFESWFRIVPDHEYPEYEKDYKQQPDTERAL